MNAIVLTNRRVVPTAHIRMIRAYDEPGRQREFCIGIWVDSITSEPTFEEAYKTREEREAAFSEFIEHFETGARPI